MTSLESRYKCTTIQVQHTINLIRWYKRFINSDCKEAHIPGDDFGRTMTKLEAQKHLNDSLNRSINERTGLKIPDNDIQWFNWKRDQQRLYDHFTRRIIIHSFDSKECRKRFADLIVSYSEY